MEKEFALLYKAISDENRLKILKLITQGDTCGCEFIEKLTITQPTMSYHVNILNQANIITSTKEGTWYKHQINGETIDQMIQYLQRLKDSCACK